MIPFNLRLFDASAGADAAGAEGGAANTTATDQNTTPSPEDTRQADYQKMLEQYADLDKARLDSVTQKLQQQATKERQQLNEQLSALQAAVAPIYQAQGIQQGDIAALSDAIKNDDTYWERGAEEAGLTVSQYKQMQMTIAENDRLRHTMQARQAEEAANRQIAAWNEEAEKVKIIYPDFDLMNEIQNPMFAHLISSKNAATRMSLQAAYEATHIEQMRQQAARTAENNLSSTIRAGANRPKEGGSGQNGAVTETIDIRKLTRDQRRELERRAERGERITLQGGKL